jgi:hypothetical protein
MALSDASKEAVFLIGYLKELGFQSLANVVVFKDNQGTGKLTENSVYHARSKHTDVRYHFIRDAVKKHPIKILYLPTEKIIADILMKALPKENHVRCILGLGLQSDNTSAVTWRGVGVWQFYPLVLPCVVLHSRHIIKTIVLFNEL